LNAFISIISYKFTQGKNLTVLNYITCRIVRQYCAFAAFAAQCFIFRVWVGPMNMLGNRRVKPQQAYVIVCGNEKGGSGKTTTAMHLAVALLMGGHKVATIDLDTRQLSFSRYVENRIAWNRRKGLSMLVPDHFKLEKAAGDSINDNETVELGRFQDILRQHGLTATIRESRGGDIQAACGQLAAARPAA